MEVADFTDAQIETFVKKWFAKEPIKCEKFLTEFKQEQYRGLRELASSPLLLGMLCLAFADSMEFTTRRVDIYEDAIDALLRKWDSSRSISRDVIYHGLNHQLKKRLFTNIAYKTFSTNQYLIKESKLVADLTVCLKQLPNPNNQECDGEVVLKAIEAQHGIFVERAKKIHSFAHLTFQEYFSACAIKNNPAYQKELMKHITDPRWREVFLLTVSLLDNADVFFELFKTAISDLIAQDRQLTELLQWTEQKSNSVQSDYQSRETRFSYLFLELTLVFDFANTADWSDYNPTAGNNSLTLDSDLSSFFDDPPPAFPPNLSLEIDLCDTLDTLDLDSSLDSDLARTRNLDLDLNFAHYSNEIGFDYLSYLILLITNSVFIKTDCDFIWPDINHPKFNELYLEIINKGLELEFDETADSLRELRDKIPAKTALKNEWQLFYQRLSEVLQSERNIGKQWSFNDKQLELLIHYFDTNKLLLDCLKHATISNREAIKNSLFLPPNQ